MRVLCLVLLSMGCDPAVGGSYAGPPLVTVRGQVSVPEGRTVPEPVRLALVWTDEQGRRSVTEGRTSLQAPWPTHFSIGATSVPRATAEGVVIAYSDVDSTQAFELSDVEVSEPHDVVLGASVVFFDGGQSGTRLRFLDEMATIPAGLQRGFNLIAPDGGVLPFSAEVPVLLTMAPELDRWRATNVSVTPPPTERPLRILGSIGLSSSTGATILEVNDAYGVVAAELTVNGRSIPFDAATLRYRLTEQGTVNASNEVVATAPGYRTVRLTVPVPTGLAIVEPTFSSSHAITQPLVVRWTPATPVSQYAVDLYDAAFTSRASAKTGGATVTIPAASLSVGRFTLTVAAQAPAVTDSMGSSVHPYQNVSVPLLLTP